MISAQGLTSCGAAQGLFFFNGGKIKHWACRVAVPVGSQCSLSTEPGWGSCQLTVGLWNRAGKDQHAGSDCFQGLRFSVVWTLPASCLVSPMPGTHWQLSVLPRSEQELPQ